MPSAATPARVFATAVTAIGVDAALFTMVVPALSVYAEDMDLGPAGAAAVFGAFPIAQLVTAVTAAGAVERGGRRPALAAACLLICVAGVAFALAGSVPGLIVARAVQGAGAGLVWTAAIAAVCDVYPADELGFRLGLAQTAAGALSLVGPLVGGLMIESLGTRTAFLIASALPLVPLVLAITGPETRVPGPVARPVTALRAVWADPAARGATLALLVAASGMAMLEPMVPVDLSGRTDAGPAVIGLVFGAMLVAFFCVAPLAGRAVDRRGSRPVVVAGAAAAVAGLPGIALLPPAGVAVCLAVTGAGLSALATPAGPELARAVAASPVPLGYGTAASALMVAWAAGYVIGPYAGAAFATLLPFTAIVVVAAAAVTAVAVRAVTLLPRVHGGVA